MISNQPIRDKDLEKFSRKLFWERTNANYAALKKDPIAWKKEQEERSAWEVTLADGIEDEKYPNRVYTEDK